MTNFNYVPAKKPHLVQRVKNNEIPNNAVAGGKGSFLVLDEDEKAKVYLTLTDENGNFAGKINIAKALREIAHREGMKLTQNRAETVCRALMGKKVVTNNIDPRELEKAWADFIK